MNLKPLSTSELSELHSKLKIAGSELSEKPRIFLHYITLELWLELESRKK